MSHDYHIEKEEPKAEIEVAADRLNRISELLASSKKQTDKKPGRNILTRALDSTFAVVRKYLPPLHWAGAALMASVMFLYAQVVALTARLASTGNQSWPNIPTPCVLTLWHRDAPSLLVIFVKRRPPSPTAIMISHDPRGDYLALLCRMIGFHVVRGDSEEGGWKALLHLAGELINGASVVITADGGGPARQAKVGAVVLASAVGAPLIPLAADCHPALEEAHKWDAARNPLPFCSLKILLGSPRKFAPFQNLSSVEEARAWLEKTLNQFKPE
jgi:lysophospholipid acyltransferase (LPLAT)-like uncharacterized protein